MSRILNPAVESRQVVRRESGERESGTGRFSTLLAEEVGAGAASAEQSVWAALTPFTLGLGAAPAATTAPADAAEPGTGELTESGAPRIALQREPTSGAKALAYDGPGACNPYFGLLKPGKVQGFENWFQRGIQMGMPGSSGSFEWVACYSATAEAAQEALRLVQQYVPEARIQPFRFWGQVGTQVSHAIALPNGELMNAGLLLDRYYHQGQGVNGMSELELRQELEQLTGSSELAAS